MIHRAIGVFASAVLGATAPAGAQDVAAPPATSPPAEEEERPGPEVTEEIVVTGSRVPRRDLTTPAPVVVIRAEEIAASGRRTVGEYLQALPEQGNAPGRGFNNGGDGSTRVSLRSLGVHRTLVLLNGRRYVAAGVGADLSVDLNTIPLAAVDRIEILKDGASPIYGSDAMGGVVNVITRKRWSGVEVGASSATSSRDDAHEYGVNLTVGTTGETGSFLLTGGYLEQGAAMGGDRWFSFASPSLDFLTGTTSNIGSSATPEGVIFLSRREAGVPNGNALWNDLVLAHPGETRFIRDPAAPSGVGWRPMERGAISGEGGDLYNFGPENYLVTPLRILSLFATGERRLAGTSRFYFETSYVNRKSDQMLAPLPLFTGDEGIVVSADNIYNPFGRDFFDMARRLVEAGHRRAAQDIDTFRVVGGMDGTLPDALGPFGGWAWDVSANWGRTAGRNTTRGFLTLGGVADALGPSFVDPGSNGIPETPLHGMLQGDDVGVCGTPASPVPDCVPLDLFGGPGSISPAMVEKLTYTGVWTGRDEMVALQATTGGELFRLAARRPVGLATGYEYRSLSGEVVPDAFTMSGDRRDVRTQITRGTSDVHELYAELSIPIVSGLTLADEVEVMAAARAFKHQRFDPDWTWKLGARWRPVRDVTFRGTASTAYRVPSVVEMFLGEALGDPNFAEDPCADLDPATNRNATPARIAACTAAGVPAGGTLDFLPVPAPVVGNPALRPETARVFTAGVVLEPRLLEGFSLTVDYWDVTVERGIGQPFSSMILDLCYPKQAGATPRLCDLVERDSTGRLVKVTDRILNSEGSESAAGIDVGARYTLPTRAGRFGAALDATWLAHHDLEQLDGTVIHGKGTYDLFYTFTALTGMSPAWKVNAGLTWGLGGLSASARGRFVSGFDECGSIYRDIWLATGELQSVPDSCSVPFFGEAEFARRVSPYWVFDAGVEYELRTWTGRTSLAAGVNNVFDKPPPFVTSSFYPRDPSAYDLIGRFFFGRVSHRF